MRSKRSKNQFPEEFADQIDKSGKLFEQQIAFEIQKSGFGLVVPNYSFLDIDQGESRELDVFAITFRELGHGDNFISPILLVSIKATSLVCFTRPENIDRYITGDISFTGVPKTIFKNEKVIDLIDFLKLPKKYHFYKYKRLSSQFWTPPEKGKEKESDYFRKGLIIPLIKALIAEEINHEKDWYFDPSGEPIDLNFYYPIVVAKDLWDCDISKGIPHYSKVSRLGFLTHYCTKEKNYDIPIDICDAKGLKELLEIINEEIGYITYKIHKNLKLFETSAFTEAQKKVSQKNNKN